MIIYPCIESDSAAPLFAETSRVGRRGFIHILAALGVGAAITPLDTLGQQKSTYQAMVLSCIDPRIVSRVHDYMNTRGFEGKYSQFTIAGAAIAAEAEAFKAWHETFWDNLAASIQLHNINRVIAINHRDCGAARIAYGAESIADTASETATHKRVLMAFKQDVQRRQPGLGVETGLMALDGSIEMFTY